MRGAAKRSGCSPTAVNQSGLDGEWSERAVENGPSLVRVKTVDLIYGKPTPFNGQAVGERGG